MLARNGVNYMIVFDEQLDTKGNYSILSEDALWNALSEHHQLALEWLKLSTAYITKE
ncbi:Uncharacterised protein [Mannheimia haemolytica]|uniref:Uncharacterized protein n=1 Tax=Mannheimia haemolytica TaxID=75985 RepID=A0A378MXB6_MANHA|nr:Uncharacterised protein [Mannheimia haemolytica]